MGVIGIETGSSVWLPLGFTRVAEASTGPEGVVRRQLLFADEGVTESDALLRLSGFLEGISFR